MSDNIGYGEFIEQAMLNVVRQSLQTVVENGLPGEHHFYITFLTQHPDTIVPDSVKAKYPHEMTIVLQNQFWNLEVNEKTFSLDLNFNKKTERMIIAFDSLLSFNDPSVQFALHFNMGLYQSETEELDEQQEKPIKDKNNVVNLADFKKSKENNKGDSNE